jgi:hypothetical protein
MSLHLQDPALVGVPGAPGRPHTGRLRGAAAVLVAVALCLVAGLLGRQWPVGSSSATPVGIADGEVPDGVTVLDDRYPAVARLDAPLLRALRAAAGDATRDGVRIQVNSGWRSARYQQQLFEEAVARYGSEAAAARWVARPGTSVHEAGGAVDVGPEEAAAWLTRHGAAYGLCRIYGNEPWHFELRPVAVRHGCPPTYADPTQDARMRR